MHPYPSNRHLSFIFVGDLIIGLVHFGKNLALLEFRPIKIASLRHRSKTQSLLTHLLLQCGGLLGLGGVETAQNGRHFLGVCLLISPLLVLFIRLIIFLGPVSELLLLVPTLDVVLVHDLLDGLVILKD